MWTVKIVLNARCNFKNKNVHCDKLTEEECQVMFDQYWDWKEKRFLLCQHIKTYKTKRPRHKTNPGSSRRS